MNKKSPQDLHPTKSDLSKKKKNHAKNLKIKKKKLVFWGKKKPVFWGGGENSGGKNVWVTKKSVGTKMTQKKMYCLPY